MVVKLGPRRTKQSAFPQPIDWILRILHPEPERRCETIAGVLGLEPVRSQKVAPGPGMDRGDKSRLKPAKVSRVIGP